MDNTRAQQKEPTLQVALDALKLTPFYNAFEISADVPEIYMQEFWITVSRHHSSLRFKLNGKSHTVNVDNFRDMLKICPKLPGQIFEEPPLEEEILSFIRYLGHTGEIKFLSDVNVYDAILPQHLTNQAMLESEVYMTYYAYATGKRINTVAKGDKPSKKKQSVTKSKGLTALSEVALTEAEQIKLATKRSLIQTHSSYASGSGADEGTSSIPGVPDVPTYKSNDEQISWKSSEEDDDNEVNVSKDNNDDADNDDDVDKDDEDNDADNQDDNMMIKMMKSKMMLMS
ncbi:hypothetical protein Tco_0626902 [Tanacetum coccineum]|uniref:Uncharacterized protein n=1 Tax=Tanacetum coccineum TaxID=301880 RepID=A0ABQ4WKZ8_9ASTR